LIIDIKLDIYEVYPKLYLTWLFVVFITRARAHVMSWCTCTDT